MPVLPKSRRMLPPSLHHSYLLKAPGRELLELTIKIERTREWNDSPDSSSPDWTAIPFGPLTVGFRLDY